MLEDMENDNIEHYSTNNKEVKEMACDSRPTSNSKVKEDIRIGE